MQSNHSCWLHWPSLTEHIPVSAQKAFNSLAPGGFQINFRQVIFKLTLANGGWGMSHEIALRWMPLDLTDDKSTLVQVMAWCRQATSHYLSRCWPRSLSPNGVTRLQWIKVSKFYMIVSIGRSITNAHCGLVTPYGDTDMDQHWLM